METFNALKPLRSFRQPLADTVLHGNVCRSAVSDNAFALRQSGYTTRVFAGCTKSSEADDAAEWVESLSAALNRFSGGALYANYLTEAAGDAGVTAAYGSNYRRLVGLKNKYDAANLFRSNRNIKPQPV